ncbi:MAG: hypothetical protein ACOYNS_18475, partial [Bacteroidota bacterium]
QQLSEHEFSSRLTPETVRTFQIIHGALMAGATMFLLVILMLHFQSHPSETTDLETVNMLSIVHAVFALSAFGASRLIFGRMFSEQTIINSPEPYSAVLGMMRGALLVRMAVLEGAAFFGLVVCIVAVTGGITQTEPVYFLNTASYILFIFTGLMTYPTKDSLTDLFRTQILKQ